jgi:hypothetical protein
MRRLRHIAEIFTFVLNVPPEVWLVQRDFAPDTTNRRDLGDVPHRDFTPPVVIRIAAPNEDKFGEQLVGEDWEDYVASSLQILESKGDMRSLGMFNCNSILEQEPNSQIQLANQSRVNQDHRA